MASPIRIQRLQELIKQTISRVVQFDLADPRIGIVTITKVKLSSDLSSCVVGYSVLGSPSQRSQCKHALDDGRGYVQRAVAKAMQTRTTPHVQFVFDETIEGSVRINSILKEVLPEEVRREVAEQAPKESDDQSRDDGE